MVIDNKQTESTISTEEDSSSVETKDGEAVKLKLSQLPLMNQVENFYLKLEGKITLRIAFAFRTPVVRNDTYRKVITKLQG